MDATLPENWLRAGKAGEGLLPGKAPERVWLTITPTAIAVPVDNTREPYIGHVAAAAPVKQRLGNWRDELQDEKAAPESR